jgi:hypothetical protein
MRKEGRPLRASEKAEVKLSSEEEFVYRMTGDSALLAAGIVLKRNRLNGRGDRGPWELFILEIRGLDGRTTSITMNDPKECPKIGEFAIIPVYVTNQGRIKEARNLAEGF